MARTVSRTVEWIHFPVLSTRFVLTSTTIYYEGDVRGEGVLGCLVVGRSQPRSTEILEDTNRCSWKRIHSTYLQDKRKTFVRDFFKGLTVIERISWVQCWRKRSLVSRVERSCHCHRAYLMSSWMANEKSLFILPNNETIKPDDEGKTKLNQLAPHPLFLHGW